MTVAEAFGGHARLRRFGLPGREIGYVEMGKGAPTVVFVAGAGDTCLMWTAVAPAIAQGHRVIAYDRAGLGSSDPGPTDLESIVMDLTFLIEGFGIGPAVIVGHSLGGVVAERLAWGRPDLVAGLVLVDPTSEALTQRPFLFRLQVAASTIPVVLARIGLLARLAQHHASKSSTTLPVELRGAFVEESSHQANLRNAQVGLAEVRGFRNAAASQRAERAAAGLHRVPVVVLSSTRGPRKLRAEWTVLQAASAHSSETSAHRVIAECGHYIHLEHPTDCVKAINDVIAWSNGFET